MGDQELFVKVDCTVFPDDLDISFVFSFFFRATPAAYGGSQARGLIGAITAGLHHSHSNIRSKSCL